MAEPSERASGPSGTEVSQHNVTLAVKRDSDVTGTYQSTHEREEADEELPFPGFVPVALKWLDQKNKLRLLCLRTITWPYPFWENISFIKHSSFHFADIEHQVSDIFLCFCAFWLKSYHFTLFSIMFFLQFDLMIGKRHVLFRIF